jgi:hypothetical protein
MNIIPYQARITCSREHTHTIAYHNKPGLLLPPLCFIMKMMDADGGAMMMQEKDMPNSNNHLDEEESGDRMPQQTRPSSSKTNSSL